MASTQTRLERLEALLRKADDDNRMADIRGALKHIFADREAYRRWNALAEIVAAGGTPDPAALRALIDQLPPT